ncbi:MAG: S-methyl-5'-thioadenosine phosphorylase [Verrucomicrobiales bacterium]
MTSGSSSPAIGVIGGSGLYEIEGLAEIEEIVVETPYGPPSDPIVAGWLEDRRVCFLPRHGKGHRILPSELNHRANIWALRSLNVRWIIAVTAVGSLREDYRPQDIVLPDQFFDRTSQRTDHTFFGEGIVAHVGFADPISDNLRRLLFETAAGSGRRVHDRGTYVNMDGPAFSTRAESETNRKLGFDLVGMTNLPEAKLAREAEIALATLAMVTDYDCWKVTEDAVNTHAVMEHVQANAVAAKEILRSVVPKIPPTPDWPEHAALDTAIFTAREAWPASTAEKLSPILGRFSKS